MERLTKLQRKSLNSVLEFGVCGNFYLAGGTAISIRYNHRYSEDFDFFTENFDPHEVEAFLREIGRKYDVEVITFRNDTLIFVLRGIRFSFFHYPYPLLNEPQVVYLPRELKIASDMDIAAMKAIAVAQRGTKKDFYDLWFLMRKNNWSLESIVGFCKRKYGKVFSEPHFVRSLVFFEDAEKEKAFSEIEEKWGVIKGFFVKSVNEYLEK